MEDLCRAIHWQGTALLLVLLIPLWGVNSDVPKRTLSATHGGSIVFHVELSRDVEITSIFWSHTDAGRKRMLAIAKPEEFKVIDDRYENRVESQLPGLSLLLSDLKEEDHGIYEAQIFTSAATVYMCFDLQVNAKSQSPRTQGTWSHLLVTISLGILLSNTATKT